jgi:dihydrofolate reductase
LRASVFIATSLDGFIARENGALDWLPGDDCEPHGYDEFMATVDAIVMGRKTFEVVVEFGGEWPFKKPVIVLSSTLQSVPHGELMSGDPAEIVARLAVRGLHHLYIDGGVTIQGFLRAGLIQRMIITRIPVLLGSGVPLFGALASDIRVEHLSTRTFKGGLVQSEYLLVPDHAIR